MQNAFPHLSCEYILTKQQQNISVNCTPLVSIIYICDSPQQSQFPAVEGQRCVCCSSFAGAERAQPVLPSSFAWRLSAITLKGKTISCMERSADLFSRGGRVLETTEYQLSICSDCRNINHSLKQVYL